MTAILRTITYSFVDKISLYQAYMPFVKNGGLFLRDHLDVKPGDYVFLRVSLFKESQYHEIKAKTIWLTPTIAQGNKPTGIGLQFIGETHQVLQDMIEKILNDMLKSNNITDTM